MKYVLTLPLELKALGHGEGSGVGRVLSRALFILHSWVETLHPLYWREGCVLSPRAPRFTMLRGPPIKGLIRSVGRWTRCWHKWMKREPDIPLTTSIAAQPRLSSNVCWPRNKKHFICQALSLAASYKCFNHPLHKIHKIDENRGNSETYFTKISSLKYAMLNKLFPKLDITRPLKRIVILPYAIPNSFARQPTSSLFPSSRR